MPLGSSAAVVNTSWSCVTPFVGARQCSCSSRGGTSGSTIQAPAIGLRQASRLAAGTICGAAPGVRESPFRTLCKAAASSRRELMLSSAYVFERYISPHPMLSFGSAGHWQCCIAPKAGALVVELDTAALDGGMVKPHRLDTFSVRRINGAEASGIQPARTDWPTRDRSNVDSTRRAGPAAVTGPGILARSGAAVRPGGH